jgi:predicted peroxiredoxin
MAGKFCVSLTHAKDDPDRATVGFVVANAALGCEQETIVFLSTEGVRLAVSGYADDVHEEGFAPLKELMASFVEEGAKYWCGPRALINGSSTRTNSLTARKSWAAPSWSSSWRAARPACPIDAAELRFVDLSVLRHEYGPSRKATSFSARGQL